MNTPGRREFLLIKEDGRIDIDELKSKLKLPSEKWLLMPGGSEGTDYLYFQGPENMQVRDIADIYYEFVGRTPLKYGKDKPLGHAEATSGECWFFVELTPTSVDLGIYQRFIDEFHRRMEVDRMVSRKPDPDITDKKREVREGRLARILRFLKLG